MSQDWIGKTIGGRYRIENLLGQGGMSAVYRAEDPNLRRPVAIKLIHSHLSSEPNFVNRFKEEAAAVARLRHPNIVQVHDFNVDGETYYMVMEYLVGETLQARLRRLNATNRFMPIDEVRHLGIQLCKAAGYAHHHDLVHRDIKPANIMLTVESQAVLMDFGIVKMIGGDYHTATGATVGTAMYMSPEQIRTERVDARADIYSLGVTLYEMFSGKPPYIANSAVTLMMMVLNDPLPDLREARTNLPDHLRFMVEKALAKDVAGRYQTMEEMADDLRRDQLAFETAPPESATTLVDEKPAGPVQMPPTTDASAAGDETPHPTPPDPVNPMEQAKDRGGFSAAQTLKDPLRPRALDATTSDPSLADGEHRTLLPVSRRILAPLAALLIGAVVITVSLLYLNVRQPPKPLLMPVGLPVDPINEQTARFVVNLGTWETDSNVEALAISPDGALLATANNRERFRFAQQRFYAGLWQIESGALDKYLTGHSLAVNDVAFSPDGNDISSASDDDLLRIWQVSDGLPLKSLEHSAGGMTSIDFSPDGLLLAAGAWDGSVGIWDIAAGNLLRSLQVDDFSVIDVAFSPDGTLLAAASDGGTDYVWDIRDGSLLYTLPTQGSSAYRVVFSPDGSRLATISGDLSISIWDLRNGSLFLRLEDHPEPVRAIVFSPGGSLLVSGSDDGFLRLWRASDGALLNALKGVDESVQGLKISSDGLLLVSASEDGAIQFWGISEAIPQEND